MVIENKVIVIGGNHHNMLGVIRALGQFKIKIIAIIISDTKDVYCKKSKYLKKSYIVGQNSEEILNILNNEINKKNKSILIPTSDYAADFIDINYDKLKSNFFLPGINYKSGKIDYYMNKYNQYLLAQEFNVKMAKCKIYNISEDIIDFQNYPCILKPVVSAKGEKADIRIVNNYDELVIAINALKKLKYKDILVQEFVNYDYECGLIGCAHNGQVILPGIIKKIRRYPIKTGNNSLSKIEIYKKNSKIEKILTILKKINYSGMFDIEIFVKNNEIILNEINFRNSGNTIAYCYNEVYIIYLWVMMVLELDISNMKKSVDKEYNYIDEYLERKQFISKNISLFTFVKTKILTRAKLFNWKNDKMVNLWKLYYSLKRRIKK